MPHLDEPTNAGADELEKDSQLGLDKENAPEIPNGGLKAWSQVAGCFFITFNTWFVHRPFTFGGCGSDIGLPGVLLIHLESSRPITPRTFYRINQIQTFHG